MVQETIKRTIDIAISAIGLMLALPVLLVLSAMICAESPGSPIFAQVRVGKDGKLFSMLKLRSMVKDAAARGSYQTQQDDPRITRLGKFIRATSLDELPQLWNVLVGDMSLVGPRPETPAQQSLYTPEDWQVRHRVRPGITGLAQISGRSDITAEDRLRCDLAYAVNPALAVDFSILRKTFLLALRRTGVN